MSVRKKKVAIITIFDNPNFGTYLQALALGLVIEQFDCFVEIIHYERKHCQYLNKLKGVNIIRKIVRFIFNYPYYFQKRKEQKFVSNYLNVSRGYYSYDDLKVNYPKADIYLTGSDQVWNTIHNQGIDKAFYLDFLPLGKQRFSYGASIGMDNIPEQFVEETKRMLSKYNSISVREESNIHLLEKIGVNNVKLVLDPTLLFDKEMWSRFVIKDIVKKRKPFCLIYSVEYSEQNKMVEEVARLVAKNKHLDIYGVYYSGKKTQISCCDKNFYFASPAMFISLITAAEYLVVSSFHGTAFSINLNKEFITVAPSQFSSRIDNLLDMCGLSSRKISHYDEKNILKLLDNKIDYSLVNTTLNAQREMSLDYIKNTILE